MADDSELLRRYAEDRSEEAFSELVRRNLGLVYHAALRHCGDVQEAEDVAQAVFGDLARKAGKLAGRPAIAGWLYTSARYAAFQSVRGDSRRRAREREAARGSEPAEGNSPGVNPDDLRPVIDDALQSLGERDREAILLRFFEGRPMGEIGRVLSVTEDAARMRIERALERMRRSLKGLGVTSTTAALEASLAAQASAALPAGAATKVAAAAIVAVPAPAILTFMSMTKLQIAVASAVAALGAAGLVLQHRANLKLSREASALRGDAEEVARLRNENVRLQAAHPPDPAQSAPAVGPRLMAAGPAARAVIPLANGMTPVETLGNAGRATARAAFATQLWAARTGNIALEASAITFGADARARLQALAATLPESMQSEYDTPEKLMAFMLAGSPHPVGGMEVLGETDSGPDDVTLQTEWQHVDDDIVHQSNVNLHQDADGWKLVVPLGLVDRASDYLSRTLSLPPAPGADGAGK